MLIPTKENYVEMTPVEFEKYVICTLNKQFENKGVEDYSFLHNTKKEAHDGKYQIDGEIKFSVMGAEITILIECKQYKGPIKREQIQVLYNKIQSTGAHKGIFVTTSYFQSGAMKYAAEHGITLISITDGKLKYEVRSREFILNPITPSWLSESTYRMAMQKYVTDDSVSVSYVDDSNELYNFIIEGIIHDNV